MKTIKASSKRSHGNNVFHIEILYPGMALGLNDTGFYTIGRIDHASFKPPGLVPMHLHRDDEIFSYMRKGSMVHRDSSGNKQSVTATHMMLMNAGSGMQHEESAEQDVEMLQIFMRPSESGLVPQIQFYELEDIYSENKWRLLAGNAEKSPLKLRVETNIFDARLAKGGTLSVPVTDYKAINFLYCFNGSFAINNNTLSRGDSIIFDETDALIKAGIESDLVLFQINEQATYSDKGMFSGNQNR